MTDRPNPVTTPAPLPAGVVVLKISDQDAAYIAVIMEREAEHWHDRHGGAHPGKPICLAAATRCENLATYIESERPTSRRFIATVHMSQRHNGETA